MENIHRDIIKRNKKRLCEITTYDEMSRLLLAKEVFTPVMLNIIQEQTTDKDLRLDKLYDKLTNRGPDAFNKLLEVFKEIKNEEATALLKTTVGASSFTGPAVIHDLRFLSIKGTNDLNMQHSNNAPLSPTNENKIISNEVPIIEEDTNPTDGGFMSKTSKKLKLEPYEKQTEFDIKSLEVKKATSFGSHHKVPVYSMKSSRRGVLFFVNIIRFNSGSNPYRNGAEKDRENLITLFREFNNFKIFYYEDLTKVQLLELLKELQNSNHLNNIDSFFFCIQTHGDLWNHETYMEFSDGQTEKIETIISMFSNINCRKLLGKPKVFFFPFCRGKISERLKKIKVPAETDGKTISEMQQILSPEISDMLVCYATIPGYATHRDIEFGSWYIEEICKVFAEHACDCSIEDLLKMVGNNTMKRREIEGRTQVASYETRGFNKILYINPKIVE